MAFESLTEKLQNVFKNLKGKGRLSEEDVKALSEAVKADFGGIDILVNSQGLNKKSPIAEQDVEIWDAMFAANVRSIMLTQKYFTPMMMEQNWGRVINVSSIGAVRCKNDDISTAYGATKGAVNKYSNSDLISLISSELNFDIFFSKP
mgnify:CR=1 FL=1